MEMTKDYSYGVIPFVKEGEEWKVFLINQYGSGGDIFWTFPKGHAEAGESPEAAARRELLEETAVELKELFIDKAFSQQYTFFYGNEQIDKTVTYFLGVATNKEFAIQEAEVKEAGWFSLEEADNKLTHEAAKAMLQEAIEALQTI